jgi:hypothetical protein
VACDQVRQGQNTQDGRTEIKTFSTQHAVADQCLQRPDRMEMRMRALAVAASMVLVVLSSHGAHAREVDMAKITCKDFLQALARDRSGGNLMWMSGYFAAKVGETIFDTDRHIRAARQVGYLCKGNPNALFIEIYRRALADNSGKL